MRQDFATAIGKLLSKLNQDSLLDLRSRSTILALDVGSLVCLEIFFIVRWVWGVRGLFFFDGSPICKGHAAVLHQAEASHHSTAGTAP